MTSWRAVTAVRSTSACCCTRTSASTGLQMTDDGICSLLKLVADRSKFELLRRCARQPSYCQQLSREMGLTTATISRHMSLLLEAGLVRARKGESRIYYTIDREAVAALCDAVYTTLLPEQLL